MSNRKDRHDDRREELFDILVEWALEAISAIVNLEIQKRTAKAVKKRERNRNGY